jgi:hypothetical protein
MPDDAPSPTLAAATLVARLGSAPPPSPTGDLRKDLAAVRAHAARTRWEALPPLPDPLSWRRGAGPPGRRVGLAFPTPDGFWLPHPEPGEVSATVGRDLREVGAWVAALHGAWTEGAARLEVMGEPFGLRRMEGALVVTARDVDGSVLDRHALDAASLARALARTVAVVDGLVDLVEGALPGADGLSPALARTADALAVPPPNP